MRIPFHMLRALSIGHSCTDLSPNVCLTRALDIPPVIRLPVTDDIGVVYAFDLAITDGFYILVVTVAAFMLLRRNNMLR
jgi:hypothetical protein